MMRTLESLESVTTAAEVPARAGAGGAEAAVSAPVTSQVGQGRQMPEQWSVRVEDVARSTEDAMLQLLKRLERAVGRDTKVALGTWTTNPTSSRHVRRLVARCSRLW